MAAPPWNDPCDARGTRFCTSATAKHYQTVWGSSPRRTAMPHLRRMLFTASALIFAPLLASCESGSLTEPVAAEPSASSGLVVVNAVATCVPSRFHPCPTPPPTTTCTPSQFHPCPTPPATTCTPSQFHPCPTPPATTTCTPSEFHPCPPTTTCVPSQFHPCPTTPPTVTCVSKQFHPCPTTPPTTTCVSKQFHPCPGTNGGRHALYVGSKNLTA